MLFESTKTSSRPSSNISLNQSSRVIRRQRQIRSHRHNLLNQTLDNFYNILRRTKADQTVKSATSWVNEYETFRKSVILEEISNINFSTMNFNDKLVVNNCENSMTRIESVGFFL
ncbi:20303_t:CDS:1 [Gigaspora margarita]|uniref:20303_t:CDS:1 n=1 Tax=Gigaspora margarita TaxID=4874 RepID=A0ABN7W033_GIGMA|nr:20303_t:CDS:1 [Gigaspora margarita]